MAPSHPPSRKIPSHRQRPLRIRATAAEAAAGKTAVQALKDARTELGSIVRHKLVEATGIEKACMHWTQSSYERVIVRKHHLELYGWPADVALQHPTGMSSVRVLHELIRSWRAGRTGSRRVPGIPEAEADERKGAGTGRRKRERAEGKRKPRRVSKVRSAEFVVDSDEEAGA